MAVQDGFGKVSGSESLVFAYDLKDTINSYRGEPATNSQNADISSMTQVGFDSWSCYDGSPPYHTWGTNQSKTFVTIPGPFGTSVNAMLYHNFNGGFYGPTDWGAVPNGTITAGRTYTVQGWVKAADSSSIGKTVTPYTYYSHSGGAYSAGTNYTLTDQWQLVSHTHTAQYNASGDGVMYFFTQNSGEVKMHLTMTGVFLDKSQAVPWIIGGSTRSNTQGLLDLTNTGTINLSTMSFNSNTKMIFDGTDDYINVTGLPNLTTDLTAEVVFRPTNTRGDWVRLIGTGGNSGNRTYGLWYNSPGNYLLYQRYGAGDPSIVIVQPLTINQYYHFAATTFGSSHVLYLNGTVIGTATASGPWPASGENVTIGYAGFHSTMIGYIDVAKLYNRALTSTEITNNYLKYKRQYGLT
jgi:hypothetical protein